MTTSYDIFYAKDIFKKATLFDIVRGSHTYLFTIEAENPEDAYRQMQGENWSPNGEGRKLIEDLGLTHTSMSINDFMMSQTGEIFVVATFGFDTLFTP